METQLLDKQRKKGEKAASASSLLLNHCQKEMLNIMTYVEKNVLIVLSMYPTIHGRRGGAVQDIPPPEKFWFEIPPLREGYSLAKYSPPLDNFRPILPPELEDSSPKIGKTFYFFKFFQKLNSTRENVYFSQTHFGFTNLESNLHTG